MNTADQMAVDDIDLRNLIAALWNGRWILIGTTFLFSTLAVIVALVLTPIYRAEAVVQLPNEAKAGGGFAAVASQLGGIGDLAALLGASDSDRALTLATLKSRVLIQQFIVDNKLMPILFEGLWDPTTGRWAADDPEKAPTLWHGHKFFVENVLKIVEDKKTGLVTIAVEWRDADVAAAWATDLISRTNSYLREKTIKESEMNLAYLQQQLKQTGQVELQHSAYALVESELKKLMLAKGNEEYAIKTIDPAQPPKRRHKPNRILIAVGGFIFGGIVGLVALFVQSHWRPQRTA